MHNVNWLNTAAEMASFSLIAG